MSYVARDFAIIASLQDQRYFMAQTNDTGKLPRHEPPALPQSESGEAGSLEAAMRRERNPVKRFFKVLGPGLITGASDDDPSGIGTYAVAGAAFGFATLWTALFTLPLMTAVQLICARIGMVSGMGLAAVLRRHYARNLLYLTVFLLVVANTINAGADIGAIAAAINLLVPVPIYLLVLPIALIILALQLWGSYRLIARTFKWLALALFAYVGSSFFARPDWFEVIKATFLPKLSFDPPFLATLVAIFGTTISPYLFFWQADQEVEEEISFGRITRSQRRGASDAEMKYARWDVYLGMFFSNLVMYFIILATAATLFKSGKTNIQSATDAAEALRPLAHGAASLLLAIGLIGSGCLAVPILTGCSAYAVAEAMGGRYGLSQKVGKAKLFYGVIIVSTLVGVIINFIGINPIRALFLAAIINGFLAPPLLVAIMLVANNRQIMGDRVNGRWSNVLGWTTTLVMFLAALALVLTWGQ
ncbi:MAG TPA: divalent metal cation transporter [Pyrinomonadaceae bacterium]|nr:divalent metal cation transporter [Pyrinomonadaceae bacterium]